MEDLSEYSDLLKPLEVEIPYETKQTDYDKFQLIVLNLRDDGNLIDNTFDALNEMVTN